MPGLFEPSPVRYQRKLRPLPGRKLIVAFEIANGATTGAAVTADVAVSVGVAV